MSEPLLRIESLAGGYGAIRILHGLDLRSHAGGATALLGANGAGKTTLMKTLAGVLPASGGRIFFRGDDITGSPRRGAGAARASCSCRKAGWSFPS